MKGGGWVNDEEFRTSRAAWMPSPCRLWMGTWDSIATACHGSDASRRVQLRPSEPADMNDAYRNRRG